jgi:P-type Ca2+ transporter type 2C
MGRGQEWASESRGKRSEGLSSAEVQASAAAHGRNILIAKKSRSFGALVLRNMLEPMILLLFAALAAGILVQSMHFLKGHPVEIIELLGISLAIVLSLSTASIFEYRNESTFKALQKRALARDVKVYRDGQPSSVGMADLVVGDVVMLALGDKIPADGYLLEGTLEVDQSSLNGESASVTKLPSPVDLSAKAAPLDDLEDVSLLFMGTHVLDGQGLMKVLQVGKQTIYGALASELQQHSHRDTPLQVKLKRLATIITRIAYLGGIAMVIIFFWYLSSGLGNNITQIMGVYGNDSGLVVDNILKSLMMAVVLLVVAVPEGLPLMIAIVSAMMMNKMLKANVLVRTNSGVESAGSLRILFTDKTGTLTKGQLQVVETYQVFYEERLNTTQERAVDSSFFISSWLQCSTAQYAAKSKQAMGGNSSERAILNWIMQSHAQTAAQFKSQHVVHVIPFNSDRKWSACVIRRKERLMSMVKGTPEQLLPLCTHYYNQHDKAIAISKEQRLQIEAKVASWSASARRVLILAVSASALSADKLTGPLAFVGMIAIADEVRSQVGSAIADVQSAGVQVVLVTGDSVAAAKAIAEEVGIYDPSLNKRKDKHVVLDSIGMHQLSDGELLEMLPRLAVVARAMPADKRRLVALAQSREWVVGMTGDGGKRCSSPKDRRRRFCHGQRHRGGKRGRRHDYTRRQLSLHPLCHPLWTYHVS